MRGGGHKITATRRSNVDESVIGDEHPAPNWSDFSLRQLAHFVAVADAGTLAGAAERLFMSPSAVAASLSELERLLGADLCVRRRAQGVTLTPVGRVLLVEAKRLLAQAAEISYLARGNDQELTGPLVVGCYVTLAPTVLPRLLETFETDHPRVTVDLVEGDQIRLQEGLFAGELDIAIMYDLDLSEALTSVPLYEPRAYALFAADHPLASADFVTLEQLSTEPLALFNQAPSARYAMSLFHDVGLKPNIRHRTQTYELTRSLVARNLAYALLVQRPTNKSSYEGFSIVEKEILPEVKGCPVVLAWPRDVPLSPRAKALERLARAHYR
ncbi:LysR family transcriptional regulator [Microbacterium caowuchunii]|nr:LysR family transcriptional regulator [Microbacterium caowuchunii]